MPCSLTQLQANAITFHYCWKDLMTLVLQHPATPLSIFLILRGCHGLIFNLNSGQPDRVCGLNESVKQKERGPPTHCQIGPHSHSKPDPCLTQLKTNTCRRLGSHPNDLTNLPHRFMALLSEHPRP